MGLAPTGVSGWAGGVPPAPVVPLVSDQLKVAQCCGPCPPPSTPTCVVPQRSCAQGLGSAQPPGDAPVGLQHREQDLRREKSPGLLLGLGRCFWVTHSEGRVRGGLQNPAPPGTERPQSSAALGHGCGAGSAPSPAQVPLSGEVQGEEKKIFREAGELREAAKAQAESVFSAAAATLARMLLAVDVPGGAASPQGPCRRRQLPARCRWMSSVAPGPRDAARASWAGCGPKGPWVGSVALLGLGKQGAL